MIRKFLLLIAIVGVIQAQTLLLTIDDFTPNSSAAVVVVTSLPTSNIQSWVSASALGGQRDFQLFIQTANPNSLFVAAISSSRFSGSESLGEKDGYYLLQYDGSDTSISLNNQGLGGVDFLANGGNALSVTVANDNAFVINVALYDTTGNLSTYDLSVSDSSLTDTAYLIEFNDFSGNVDFSDIGAIELKIPFISDPSIALDFTMSNFGVVSTVASTPTHTPSIIAQSASNTPSRTHTKSTGASSSRTNSLVPGTRSQTPAPLASASSAPSVSVGFVPNDAEAITLTLSLDCSGECDQSDWRILSEQIARYLDISLSDIQIDVISERNDSSIVRITVCDNADGLQSFVDSILNNDDLWSNYTFVSDPATAVDNANYHESCPLDDSHNSNSSSASTIIASFAIIVVLLSTLAV
jgi:hypothetical protein